MISLKRSGFLVAMLLAMLVGGCKGKTNSGSKDCGSDGTCASGAVCIDDRCATLCNMQRDCAIGEVCGSDGYCIVQQPGSEIPVIETIIGNDTMNATRVADGMHVTGQFLANASFELQTATTPIPLTVRARTDSAVELVFPADIRAGDYMLVATNAAGSDQASVTLTLPDLNGELLITRINAEASTALDIQLLPVGNDASSVAAGDHLHAYYLTSDAIEEPFVPNADYMIGTDGLDRWDVVADGVLPTYDVLDATGFGAVGPKAFVNGASTRATLTSQRRVPVNSNAVYRVSGYVKESASGGAGTISLGVRIWDATDTELLDGNNWWVYAARDFVPSTNWGPAATSFGASTTQPFPVGATTMSVAVILNDATGVPGNSIHKVQGLSLVEVRFLPVPVHALNPTTSVTLGAADAGVVRLSPAADAVVTLPQTEGYAGIAYELFNRSSYILTVQASDGSFVLYVGPFGSAHLVAAADPPSTAVDWLVRSRTPMTETLIATGTWEVPQGVTQITALLVGGGGGGGGGDNNNFYGGGGGGGGGGGVEVVIDVVPGDLWDYSVGIGGNAAGTNANATAGTATTFSSAAQSINYAGSGGQGGSTPTAFQRGGAGGDGSLAAGAGFAEPGTSYYDGSTNFPGGKAGRFAGGGGGGARVQIGGGGASTVYALGGNGGGICSNRAGGGGGGAGLGEGGGGGTACGTGVTGQAGMAPGGGGGGGASNAGGGPGAGGTLVLRY